MYLKLKIVKRNKAVRTKKAMKITTVRLPAELINLVHAAAAEEGASQAEFLRQALRERAERVLRKNREERTTP